MSHDEILRPDAYAPEVGVLLSMMEDCRARTLREVERIDPSMIDAPTPWSGNTIGSLLYHIGAIELDWLYSDIMQRDFPEEAWAWFPHDVREEDGRLTPAIGETVDRHLERLAWVRARTRGELRTLSTADLMAIRSEGDDSSMTIEWILHHLLQHEVEHRGQLAEIRTALAS